MAGGHGHAPHEAALEALGDGSRRAILEILSAGGRSVQQIADGLEISRPAVSRHLRVLKAAGLVSDRAEGARRIYRLDGDGVDAVRRYFAQVWADAASRFRMAAENLTPAPEDP